MFRASSDPASPYVGITQTVGNGVSFEYRTASGAIAQYTENGPVIDGLAWMRMVRVGNVYTGYASSDGMNYTAVGSVTLTLPSTAQAGLATTSHDVTLYNTATFDNVSVSKSTPAGSLPLPWMNGDIGSPAISGSTTYLNGVNTLKGSGAGLRQGLNQFHLADQMASGDTTIIARLDAQKGGDHWAKLVLMIRATSDPASPYVAIFNAVGAGLTFEWHTASGAIAQYTENGPIPTGPIWLKLIRSGSTFTGYN